MVALKRKTRVTRPIVRVTGFAFIAIVLLAGIELSARVALMAKDVLGHIPALASRANSGLDLDPYKMPSPNYLGHWVLVPGYGADTARVIADKAANGRDAGAAAIADAGTGRRLEINLDGFKGPPIDGTHAHPRILVLGDSVTFGYPAMDYVRAMEASLVRLGLATECINGGVEGYSVKNHLLRLSDYAKLKPDMVLVLMGWNDLFSIEAVQFHWWGQSAALRLSEKIPVYLKILTTPSRDIARQQRDKIKTTDPNASEVATLASYHPQFIERLEQLGDAMEAQGAKVVVATLPGLYLQDQFPSAKALEIGHLPDYTSNPFAFAAVTEAANADIRRLAARKGWGLADLAEWSRGGLAPRDTFFVDTVHMTAEAYARMGDWLAQQLAPVVRSLPGKESP
jgi:lysophospholipase L1-like esterase